MMYTADVLRLSDECLFDWLASQGLRTNVLVFSPDFNVELVAECLSKRIQAPVCPLSPHGNWMPPADPAGVCVLADVARMTDEEQRRFDDWLSGPGVNTRIVAISSAPLWPRVAAGRFLDRLYYRLNTVVLEATVSGRAPYDEGVAAR